MLIEKLEYIDGSWRLEKKNLDGIAPDIVLFGKRLGIQDRVIYRGLRKLYPYADIVGCSSSGNIFMIEYLTLVLLHLLYILRWGVLEYQ